jgi:hypothetical protein
VRNSLLSKVSALLPLVLAGTHAMVVRTDRRYRMESSVPEAPVSIVLTNLCQVKPHVHSSVGNLRDDATERSCSGKAICPDEQRTALRDRGLAHGDGDLAELLEKLYPACRVKGSWATKPSSTRVSRLPWKHSNDVIPLSPSCNDLNF